MRASAQLWGRACPNPPMTPTMVVPSHPAKRTPPADRRARALPPTVAPRACGTIGGRVPPMVRRPPTRTGTFDHASDAGTPTDRRGSTCTGRGAADHSGRLSTTRPRRSRRGSGVVSMLLLQCQPRPIAERKRLITARRRAFPWRVPLPSQRGPGRCPRAGTRDGSAPALDRPRRRRGTPAAPRLVGRWRRLRMR